MSRIAFRHIAVSKTDTVFLLVSALSILGILFAAVLVHELTHVFLAGGARGICFGNCDGAIARVWVNSSAGHGELLPNIAGCAIACVLSIFLFTSKLFRGRMNA